MEIILNPCRLLIVAGECSHNAMLDRNRGDMMSTMLEVRTAENRTILVETVDGQKKAKGPLLSTDKKERLFRAGVTEEVKVRLADTLRDLGGIAKSFSEQFEGLDPAIEKAEVELGVGIEAKGMLIIFQGAGQANFKVKLTWSRTK
ncbi:MAG: hypothetical protein HY912_04955 [Desulfomonile tiedjei]|uniref:Trypsin-co-occurring domain-containing protein n=1 Tax=Desulfomonile tiedjei TaxID=2358 RepID=A0A9D6V167_9BACT|nr:hypothetical protein [Desulfomonile tiedjei]